MKLVGLLFSTLLCTVANDPTCKSNEDHCYDGGLNLHAAKALVTSFWGKLAQGDANAYAAAFSPDAKFIVNNEEMQMNWQDADFNQDLFNIVTFSQPKVKGPLVMTGPSSILCTTEWQATVLTTGETITIGAWNVATTFDDNRRVTEQRVVVDAQPWRQFLVALQPLEDTRKVVETLVTSLRNKDKAGVIGVYSDTYGRRVNGVQDNTPWTDDAFLTLLFARTTWDCKIAEFKALSSNAAHSMMHCNVEVIAGPLSGQTISWMDAWTVMFQDQKINIVNSIMDSAAFAQLDEALK